VDVSSVNAPLQSLSDDLKDRFDAVVMLTWSDWKTEPRSNRYHYASRFARKLPVYFVQPSVPPLLSPLERTELPDVTILHAGTHYGRAQSQLIEATLARLDVRRPLIWVYNVFYSDFIARHTNQMIVYHGTEDYLRERSETFIWTDMEPIIAGFERTLPHVDMTISVAESIRRNFRERGGYQGPSLLVPNGCDDKFWIGQRAYDHVPPSSGRPVAFYQGAINTRLDFDLLHRVVRAMPDWDFSFCGRSVDPPGWSELLAEPNVKYLGMLPLEKVARAARGATVAIAPFVDQPLMRISVNLKYYEYVACGLPVVSSPNDALLDRPDVFTVASDAEDFVKAVRALAPSRTDSAAIKHRLEAAGEQSYDKKFDLVCSEISRCRDELAQSPERRNVLVLFRESAASNNEVLARLVSLKERLSHNVYYFPCLEKQSALAKTLIRWDPACFDVVVIDSSLIDAGSSGINVDLVRIIRNYDGCKIAMSQDTQWRRKSRVLMETLRVDTVVANLGEAALRAGWGGAQRVPAVVAWEEGTSASLSAIVDRAIASASFKKPRADLMTMQAKGEDSGQEDASDGAVAYARPDSKDQIVKPKGEHRGRLIGAVDGKEDLTMAVVLPSYGGSFDLKLLGLVVLRLFVRAFFYGWDRLPNFIRTPIVSVLPKRMREAMRAAGPKLFAR
jgi:glycosyltransferase involved in cell wall biosynthesis